MERKNVLGLLTIIISVLVLAATGFSQECPNVGDGLCGGCPKCPVGSIPCPTTSIISEGQVTQEVTTELFPFDYDGKPNEPIDAAVTTVPNGFGGYGYCSGHNYADDNLRDCKFLFDVCACPDSCDVQPGTKVGIQMIIDVDGNPLTDDGVYFADPTMTSIPFDILHLELNPNDPVVRGSFPCNVDNVGQPLNKLMTEAPIYFNQFGTRVSALDPAGSQVDRIRTIDQIVYYRGVSIATNKDGDCNIQLSNQGQPRSGGLTTSVPINNRVFALESSIDGDYLLTDFDAQQLNCVFWIDIPPMRIDPTKAESLKGKTINVKVRLIFNREKEFCPDCDVPDYCECERAVAKVCCEDVRPDDEGCLYFPYVLQGILDSSGWSSGVAITAKGTLPTNATCTLTLKDSQGNTATYTKTGVDAMWSFVLDNIMSEFNATLLPGAVSMEVTSNYRMDGYSFLNVNGMFGAGTLPRACDSPCAP